MSGTGRSSSRPSTAGPTRRSGGMSSRHVSFPEDPAIEVDRKLSAMSKSKNRAAAEGAASRAEAAAAARLREGGGGAKEAARESTESLEASMARYRDHKPLDQKKWSFDGLHPTQVPEGNHYKHLEPHKPGAPEIEPSKMMHDDDDDFDLAAVERERKREAYVAKLESELASMKRAVAGLGDPLEVAMEVARAKATTTTTTTPAEAQTESDGSLAEHLAASGKATAASLRPLSAKAEARGRERERERAAARAVAEGSPLPSVDNPRPSVDDLELAKAIFSDDRLAAFEAALEAKFKASGGYDSDLSPPVKAPRAKTPEPARESFEEQNAWMDEYRARVADEKSKSKSKSKSSTPAVTAAESKKKDDDASTGADAGADADPLVSVSAAEMEAARRAVDSTRIRAQSAPRARTRAHKHCAAYLGEGPHGDGLPRPKELIDRAVTKPKPFSFEAREKTKTKTISEQRLEQDLAIAAELERITINKPFKATSIPRSTVEPRYQRMIERETMKREERRESRKAALVESEKPFSFYLRDKEAKRYTLETAAERTARRANKFQRRFKAKEIPAAVKALKLGDIEARDARRKEAAKAAAVAKLAQSRLPERMALHANEGGGGHGASSDASTKPSKPKWSFKPAPAKEVPDFDALHEKFFRRLQSARGDFVATVPREFRLREHTKEEKEAIRRKLKSDIAADEENLPENRWPFASLRAKVHPSPPPAFSSPGENFYKKNENLATKLRRQAMLKQRQAGHYATRAEKEAREDAARERDAKRRAAAWAHSQVANAGAKALDADGGTKGPGGKLAGARANAKGPADQHRAARHAQQATLARETVEKVLLENDVYTYVEEGEDGPF